MMNSRKLGYPYFYGNKILKQDKISMIFSLDPIPENSDLNLTHGSSLPIVAESIKIGLGDEFSYQFCDQISQICGKVSQIPETKTLVFEYNTFCNFVTKSDIIIDNISSNLLITKESAIQQAQDFFDTKTVVVQAGGVQGALYKMGSYLQSAGSAGLVANTLGLARLAGVNGLQILIAQPALAIAIPTTGAIFFYGCGSIAGGNLFGKALITTGDVLALPMKGTEMLWNSYANPVIQKIFGIPVILNMTQTFKTGTGYTVEEIGRYISFNKPSLIQGVKNKIIEWLK